MPIDLSNKPVLTSRGFDPNAPRTEAPFDPSQLTNAKAQIEYLVNTGKLSPEDANKALKPYGAKLDLQPANKGRGPGGRDYYQVTGRHSLLKEFVLPASLMVGAGVGLNALVSALAAAPAAATTPTLGGVGLSGSAPAATGITAGSATLGPGVGFGAGGTPIAASLGSAAAPSVVAPAVTAAAGGGLPFWGKALIGFGTDALKTYLGNRASGKANDALQEGGDKAVALHKEALGPYMGLGANAAGSLGYLMGMGPMPSFAGGPSSTALPIAAEPKFVGSGRTMAADTQPTSAASAIPRAASPHVMADPQSMAGLGGGALNPAQAMTRSSFVRMRAPDGEEDDVPAQFVQDALRRGAVQVGA